VHASGHRPNRLAADLCGSEAFWFGRATPALPQDRNAVARAIASVRSTPDRAQLFRGMRAPFLRALLSPMAIACLRDFTLCLPERM